MEQMKVLIIDDNEKVRLLLRDYLPTSVDEIYECADGSQAFAAYQKHRPDWVLMDIRMGGLDGLRTTEAIKQSHPDARVIIVTNYDDPAFRTEARRLGTDGYVLKENLAALRNIMKREVGGWV